jgi:hypothetical protein
MTSALNRIPRTGAIAALFALAAVLLGATAAEHPRWGTTLCELVALVGVLVCLRRGLSVQQRAALAALAIGVGELTAPLGSASNALFAVLIMAATPRLVGAWSLAKLTWGLGCGCLLASVILTSGTAKVSASVILGLIAALAASSWMFASAPRREGWPPVPGLDIVENAGLIAAGFVILSYLLGHGLVATTASMARDALVAGGTTRASGSFTSPNEAALVISAGLLAMALRVALDSAVRVVTVRRVIGASCAVIALLLTGSRASVLAAALGCLIVAVGVVRRRPLLVGSFGALGMLAILAGSALGTFTGRGLNVFASNDPSSEYRREVTRYLLARVDWTQMHGFGFAIGNQLAVNPVSGTLPNVDEAWLYLLLTLGALSIVGIVLVIIASTMRAMSTRAIMALAGLAWLAVVSPSENLFLLPGPCVCAMLLLACVSTTTDLV